MSQPTQPKLHKILADFGKLPLADTPIATDRLKPTRETILAMAIDAMIKSRPISHDLSQRAVNSLLKAGYHDVQKLVESTWEERTMVLKDGGYNRYREQGATNLGELARFVLEGFDGDLNNLQRKANNNRLKVRELVKGIKGLGDLGADIFLNNVQSVWPDMAPFVDSRSLKAAEEVGIETDLKAIFKELKEDPVEMSRLANGLSMMRLEKRVREVEEVDGQ